MIEIEKDRGPFRQERIAVRIEFCDYPIASAKQEQQKVQVVTTTSVCSFHLHISQHLLRSCFFVSYINLHLSL